jgi:protein CpxP
MKTKTIGTLILATTLSLGGLSYAVAANQDGMKKGQNNNQNCTMMMEDGQGKYKGGKHKGKGKGKNRGQNQQMGFEKLNLTDEQKAEMKTIMSSQKGQKRVQKTDTERLAQQAEMQSLMQAETFDEAKAEELISNQQSKRNANKLEKMKAKHAMYQLLTDEQKAEFVEMQMQRKNR